VTQQKILCILQRPCDHLGFIADLLIPKGYVLERCYPCNGESLPQSFGPYQAVIIFGGSMSANDEHLPAIRAQLDWIPQLLESGIPVLGICLGGQLLARSLGATVQCHAIQHVDIGYVPIQATAQGSPLFSEPFYTYHWNQEGFNLPHGATLLATGQNFPNQAFRYGNAYGIQFHPEVTLNMIHQWAARSNHMLSRPGAQRIEEQLAMHDCHGPTVQTWLNQFLEECLLLRSLVSSAE
jgi:GMP synthase (glutamine-hydrolysing)